MHFSSRTSLPPIFNFRLSFPAANLGKAAEQNCLALLETCKTLPSLLRIQTHILKSGLDANLLVLTKFTSTSSVLGYPPAHSAALLFSPTAPTHLYDTFLFNTIIRSFTESTHSKPNAFVYFSLMLRQNLAPNNFTFPFLLKACASMQDLALGLRLHCSAVRFGLGDDQFVRNTLIHMYSACGHTKLARRVFDGTSKSDCVTWSSMISGYVRSKSANQAVDLFREMQVSEVRPDEVTIITVLSACADIGGSGLSKWILSYIDRENVPKTLSLSNALLDMLAKCGDVDTAVSLFSNMSTKTIISYTSMITGLATHGRGREAVELFDEMMNYDIIPDDVSFIGVLSACSHSGMVEDGFRYFEMMTGTFGIEPKIEHYGCMVDLLTRAGLVDRAVDFTESMPVNPNAVILRTLVGACQVHGKFDIGQRIMKRLVAEDPTNVSNYVASANVYASMCQWEKKSDLRLMMMDRGLSKVPGWSSVEISGDVYEFVAGDTSNPRWIEIFQMAGDIGRYQELNIT